MAAKKDSSKKSTPKASFRDQDLKILWGFAAARCAKCRIVLVEPATSKDPAAVVGQIAHIRSYKVNGPRYEASYPADLLHRYDNLILLCPNHHGPVDKQESSYTTQDLESWKREHERWVQSQLRIFASGVGFAELEVVAKALLKVGVAPSSDFRLLDPASKMARNQLTGRVLDELMLGLMKAKEVEKLLVAFSMPDADFAERLKAGFTGEYLRLRSLGLDGDGLFHGMAEFASAGSSEFRYQAAGRQLLAYFFEKCEVFEK